jgi:hypothetical protein
MIPNKFPPMPKAIFNSTWTIILTSRNDDGDLVELATKTESFNYSSKSYQVVNAEKEIIRLEGKLLAMGDIFPSVANISTGRAEKEGIKHKIYKGEKVLNPDGTVYATILELM